MTATQATAEVFWTAFQALKKNERAAVVQKLMQDERTFEDLRYAMIIDDRKSEPTISLRNYLTKREKKKR